MSDFFEGFCCKCGVELSPERDAIAWDCEACAAELEREMQSVGESAMREVGP